MMKNKKKYNNINNFVLGDVKVLDVEREEKPEDMKLVQQSDKDDRYIDDDKRNNSQSKDSEETNGKLYRYERNATTSPNRGIEVVKSVLYWFKDLILNTNKQ